MHANYHTHTFRCGHAAGREEEYILRAIECGITEMGFSDHAPFLYPEGIEAGYCVQTRAAEDYIETLRALKEKFRDKLNILIGFEMEYYPRYFNDMRTYVKSLGAEYLLLGQHFIGDKITEMLASYGPEHSEEQLILYTDTIIEGMKSGSYSYVAHPDMLTFNSDAAVYAREALRLCEASKKYDIPLEINLLGIFEGRGYPNEKFLKIAGNTGVKMILGFDAHTPERAFDAESLKKAEELVRKFGINLIDKLDIKSI